MWAKIEAKIPQPFVNQVIAEFYCGDNRIRTDDLLHAMQAL